MKFKKLLSMLLICATSLLTNNIFAMEGGNPPQDPLARINYRKAFDQTKIHAGHRELMEKLGCVENVFDQEAIARAGIVTEEPEELEDAIAIDIGEPSAGVEELEALVAHPQQINSFLLQKNYDKACLDQLRSARRWAITEDAREAATMMALLFGGAMATAAAISSNSMGGSFGFMIAFMNAAYFLRPAIRSLYNFLVPPAHPLNTLEERFAINQCFIPKTLWPVIMEKFMIARSNPFEQRTSMEFLEFALGLTIHKPKPEQRINLGTISARIQELFRKIDTFFDDYNEQSDRTRWLLKGNVAKFISSLLGDKTESPRYLYLHGVGGIGKTHFINKLSEWIEVVVPGSVTCENIVITSSEELEGSSTRPGAFLRVLRNQCQNRKMGSIVFMDEATWLNKDDMISPAKRAFNGDQSRLSTSYFGSGSDGTGINLKTPPMLIFVASNDEIKDPALKTRFDTIEFPTPKKEKLIGFAQEVANKSKMLTLKIDAIEHFNFVDWIDDSGINNFRDVESNVVSAILSEE